TKSKYEDAVPFHHRALAIDEKVYGQDRQDAAIDLHNLAGSWRSRGRAPEADPLYLQSLAIREKMRGPEHPDVAQSLNNRAGSYRAR
ncbi:unnamed protein product, partial [Discosporangium mesarthrocarpum]